MVVKQLGRKLLMRRNILLLLDCIFRYIPNGVTGNLINKPIQERRFEGIRLESPGPNVPNGPLQHLQICEECYGVEYGRITSGLKSRLPGNLNLGDLARVVSYWGTCYCCIKQHLLVCRCASAVMMLMYLYL
eukprot:GHUV01033970.1.p1 GENE.GHUV01033970.1~~GHUV01033970.1.p1  ORF type:complete len:154 (-),score=22.56 GHUV01033970.1:354-749(-)